MKGNKVLDYTHKQAIGEYTEFVRFVTLLKSKNAGNTGFIGELEDLAQKELENFLGLNDKGKEK